MTRKVLSEDGIPPWRGRENTFSWRGVHLRAVSKPESERQNKAALCGEAGCSRSVSMFNPLPLHHRD